MFVSKMAALPALFGLLLVSLVSGQGIGVDIEPKSAVRKVGEELVVLCRAPHEIASCRFEVGTLSYLLMAGQNSGNVVYNGEGFQKGQCGARFTVTADMNGNISCFVPPPPAGSPETKVSMRLTVATPPKDISLYTPHQPSFMEGDRLEAQCVVTESRPAANISWFMLNPLGEAFPITQGLHKPVISLAPGTGDLETISQNLTMTLTPEESNKQIFCKADHMTLTQPKTATRQIIVEYPPKALESGSQITIFGLKLGAEGRLNVTIRSNPGPSVEWTVGDQRLTPSTSSFDGSVTALEPVALGNGYYNCSLVLSRIAKEDVDRTYYLRARNIHGSEEFAVRLSTLDEPAGMELNTGAIVGIVIGVLVVLVAVFLVVFAKATDRWCFGARRGAKGSGESTPAGDVLLEAGHQKTTKPSDTESAVGGAQRSRLAELGARVRAVLPRAKDKVQTTEAPANDAEPLSEKDGVVYAELSLSSAARDKPPPAKSEYAEIVMAPEQKAEEPKEAKE